MDGKEITMRHIDTLKIYKDHLAGGFTEQESMAATKALDEAEIMFRCSSDNIDELATKKDLKIALLEFAKEYKLEWMNIKINVILWTLSLSIPAIIGILVTILLRLPK
jgi:hypothetical protein